MAKQLHLFDHTENILDKQQLSWTLYFLNIAKAVAQRSTCPRAQVGAVITNGQNRILSTGYNGAPSGEPDCFFVGCDMVDGHCIRTVHAEENAIVYGARFGVAIEGARMWVYFKRGNSDNYGLTNSTLSIADFPCTICGKMMQAAGIQHVHMEDDKDNYDIFVNMSQARIDILNKMGAFTGRS